MLSDPVKLLVLAVLTVLCLGTLFTSPSITMGNPSMRVMRPNVPQHCMVPRKQVNNQKCASSSKETPSSAVCTELQRVFERCDRTVRRAYQHINLGGCPLEIKAVTLCDAEWCHSSASDASSCLGECATVNDSLANCIQQQVSFYFKRSGLDEDGTLSSQTQKVQ
jgi:hypothetical protein